MLEELAGKTVVVSLVLTTVDKDWLVFRPSVTSADVVCADGVDVDE